MSTHNSLFYCFKKIYFHSLSLSDTTNYGCDGGNTETAYTYVKLTGGVELESDYPYTSYYDVSGACVVDSSKFVVCEQIVKALCHDAHYICTFE